MNYVLDTTIVVQRLIRDTHTENVRALFVQLTDSDQLVIPEFCLVECTNVIWKQVRFHNMPSSQATTLISNLVALPLTVLPASKYLSQSLTIGVKYQLAVYDSIYLVIAKSLNYSLITDDLKQANAATSEGITLEAITDFIEPEQE